MNSVLRIVRTSFSTGLLYLTWPSNKLCIIMILLFYAMYLVCLKFHEILYHEIFYCVKIKNVYLVNVVAKSLILIQLILT